MRRPAHQLGLLRALRGLLNYLRDGRTGLGRVSRTGGEPSLQEFTKPSTSRFPSLVFVGLELAQTTR